MPLAPRRSARDDGGAGELLRLPDPPVELLHRHSDRRASGPERRNLRGPGREGSVRAPRRGSYGLRQWMRASLLEPPIPSFLGEVPRRRVALLGTTKVVGTVEAAGSASRTLHRHSDRRALSPERRNLRGPGRGGSVRAPLPFFRAIPDGTVLAPEGGEARGRRTCRVNKRRPRWDETSPANRLAPPDPCPRALRPSPETTRRGDWRHRRLRRGSGPTARPGRLIQGPQGRPLARPGSATAAPITQT